MKFSLRWLADFISAERFFNEPEKLTGRLTQAGLEVDSYEDQKAQFKNVIVAKIESVEKHLQADRLTLCQVFTGEKIYSIVCGAKNHKAGDKVILALPGAILPGDLKIKKTRIRGIDSEGMLASRRELGFESEEEGIWILSPEAEVGKSFSEQEGLDDVIFDITVPPNRSDCLSHKGLAREISCLFSIPFSAKEQSLKMDSSVSVKKSLSVEVKDKTACPRYCGRLIEEVSIGESPEWLKQRLKSLGLKSINNVVDITNFVLWDRGQPLHAFDRDKIQSLTVNRSQKGEKFLALDENERVLTEEDLTIRDNNKVLALAGVIGGMDSGITEETKNVFIESAGFAPEKIRRTSRRFGLETDSSYRFARGIDPLAVKEAMDLACCLIQKEAGGKVSTDFYDIYRDQKSSDKIEIRLEELEERLGYEVSSSLFQDWMKRLDCQIKSSKNSFEVLPPSYRQDLKIKEDLIEEFARLEGYDKIPETLVSFTSTPKESDPRFLNSQKLIHFLSGKGWHQALNYSFCDPEYYREFLKDQLYLEELTGNWETNEQNRKSKDHLKEQTAGGKHSFSINNPISRQLSLMKPLLIPDVVKNVVNNFRHNNKFGQIFELSSIFYQEENSYKQELHLGLARWGSPVDIWTKGEIPNVYHIKSVLEAMFKAFGRKGWSWRPAEVSFLHPGQTLLLTLQNQCIGFLASLHPRLLQKYKIPLDLAVAEIHWEFLNQKASPPLKFKNFSNLLTVEKDLCFVIPPDLLVEDIRKEIKKSLGSLCEKVEVFDLYEKQKERSVSFRMYLTPEDKSWTDDQLQAFLNQVIDRLQKKFSIHLK